MSDPPDKDSSQNAGSGEPAAQPPGTAPAQGKRSGRVAFDARGNPIWEWQLETGVYSRDINTQKLKKLDLGDLSIAETAVHKQLPGLSESGTTAPAKPAGGFNPYDNSSRPNHGDDPYDSARALANKIKNEAKQQPVQAPAARRPVPPAPAPVRKKSALGRLEQWFREKRRAKDDEGYE